MTYGERSRKMRLIEAEPLIKKFEQNKKEFIDIEPEASFAYEIARQALEEAPTVDAEPVRHGYWKPVLICAICSNCGNGISDTYYADEFKYCPYCGRKMDEEADDE